MKQALYFIFILIFCLLIVSCKKEKKIQQNFEKFVVDESLPQNDTIKLLSKYPELKLYRTDVNESKSRTAYIVQESTIWNMSGKFDNYKCKANLKDDTLNISLNNNNKQSANGVLVRFLMVPISLKIMIRKPSKVKKSSSNQKQSIKS